uniref:G_PROTEIN_RECEP_F1_2 domain-containing protein n=1 Tax=Haemonchus contortus TaxID=6289 RepID=A0A7I4YRF5_HAECO
YVLCVISAPIYSTIGTTFVGIMYSFNILILVCYAAQAILLRKTRLGQDNSKQIHRSLVVISLTTVFGWFSATIYNAFNVIFTSNGNKLHAALVGGLFVNLSCASNFFVYYFISTMYRREFDKYLMIGSMKKAMGFKIRPCAHEWAAPRLP